MVSRDIFRSSARAEAGEKQNSNKDHSKLHFNTCNNLLKGVQEIMERYMKWPLNLLPVNKKREETGKLLLKYCFVLQWHIGKLWCAHILFTLSQLSKSLNFVHVIKQTWKDCCISYWFLTEGFWWENPRKSWRKLMNIL